MPQRPAVLVSKGGAKAFLRPATLARLARSFRERHHAPLGRILEDGLLAESLGSIRKAAFAPCDVKAERYINCLKLVDHRLDVRLSFLLNDARLFDAVRAITGCPPIKGFLGRVIRHDPGARHYLDWHCDVDAGGPDRLVALRLNLSPRRFQGGDLLFRGAGETEVASAFRRGSPGEAVIFRATKDSFHCNSAVRGTTPKIALSGWFYAVERDGGTIGIPGRTIFSSRTLAG